MDYVTDTHSILWYFTQDPRLSKRSLEVFEGTVREAFIIIPAVVNWYEKVVRKGKLKICQDK